MADVPLIQVAARTVPRIIADRPFELPNSTRQLYLDHRDLQKAVLEYIYSRIGIPDDDPEGLTAHICWLVSGNGEHAAIVHLWREEVVNT